MRGHVVALCGLLAAVAACPSAAGSAGAALGARVLADPLQISLSLSTDAATVGKTVRASATLRNIAATAVTDVLVELRVDPSGIAVKDARAQTVDTLKSEKHAVVSWSLCGREAGTYVVLARATGASPGGAFASESPAALLSVIADPRRTCR